MFYLESNHFQLELQVVPVDALLQHEETLSEPLRKLTLALQNQAHLHNPIIIDENNIVLDGNHRAFAFKKLNFKHIAACRINYFHKETKLRYWYRHFTNAPPLSTIKRAVQKLKGEWLEVADKGSLQKALEQECFCCGVQRSDSFVLIRFHEDRVSDAVTAYEILNRIQGELLGEGSKLKYIPCNTVHDTDFCEGLDQSEVVLWTPRITKEMVIDAAKRLQLFTPKATRHLIPARPLNVDVPTEWFKEDVSLKEMNLRFRNHLQRKNIQRFGPGQVVHGRYYEEELFVFFDKEKS